MDKRHFVLIAALVAVVLGFVLVSPRSALTAPTNGAISLSNVTSGLYTIVITGQDPGGIPVGNATLTVNVSISTSTPPCQPPTATITANGVSSVTVNPGDTVNFAWSSTNGVPPWVGTFTDNGSGPNAWTLGDTENGTYLWTVPASAVGHTYVGTYTVTNCLGQIKSASVTYNVVASPSSPSVSIFVNPSSVPIGNSATLSWSSSDVTNCTASGDDPNWTGNQATTMPQFTVTPPSVAGPYDYGLQCSGPDGPASGTTTLTVVSPQPTFRISPTAATIQATVGTASFSALYDPDGSGLQPEQNVTLSAGWSVSPTTIASEISAGQFAGTAAGSAIVSATYGSLPPATANLNVTAAPDFSCSISPSSQSILQWNSKNYTVRATPSGGFMSPISLSVSRLPADVTPTLLPQTINYNGSATLKIAVGGTAVPGTYSFRVTGSSGSLRHTCSPSPASLTVLYNSCPSGPGCPPPPFCTTFTAAPSAIIVPPQTSTLNYNCSNVTSCTIMGSDGETYASSSISTGSWVGNQPIHPIIDTTYRLSCSGAIPGNASYNTSTTVQVIVNNNPGLRETNP